MENKIYRYYVKGRNTLGLQFKVHRTYRAFVTLEKQGYIAAWKNAVDDNRTYGCHLLPAEVKATLEVAGVLLIALVGLLTRGNKKSAVSLLGVIACVLLATTASGAEDNGGSTESNDSSTQDCAHPAWAQVYDLGSSTTRCTLCGTEWVDEE